MSTITREWLQQTITEYEANRDELPFGLDTNSAIELQAFKLALASLEAEPVHQFIYNNPYEEGYTEWLDCNKDYFNGVPEDCRRILYTAPPVPVSVPEKLPCDLENEWILVDAANKNNSILAEKVKGDDFEIDGPLSCYQAGKIDGWNEYRAVMLQGAEINSPVIPDGWVACSERMPDEDGNYWGWWSESKRQGPVWFIKSELQAQFQSSEITHWMPLPAAPQQEKSL